MGLCSTEAVVLRTYKLADADKIVLVLTHRRGCCAGSDAERANSKVASVPG